MAEGKKKPTKDDHAKRVPPERWSVERPFDSAEYLDRDAPGYADGDGDPDDVAGSA